MISLTNIFFLIGSILLIFLVSRAENYKPVNPILTGIVKPLYDYRERPLPASNIKRHAIMSELPFCTPLLEATGRCVMGVDREAHIPYEQNKI